MQPNLAALHAYTHDSNGQSIIHNCNDECDYCKSHNVQVLHGRCIHCELCLCSEMSSNSSSNVLLSFLLDLLQSFTIFFFAVCNAVNTLQ